MSAYWVVRVAVRDADKLTAYAPLALLQLKTMAGVIWHVAGRMKAPKAAIILVMSLSNGQIWKPPRKPITARNIPMQKTCWVMGLTACL